MKSNTFKSVALFFITGLGSGLVSVGLIVSSLFPALGWVGIGAVLLPALLLSTIIAVRLSWLSLKLSVPRCISAGLLVVAAYPISVLVMLESASLYGSLYAVLLPLRWHERLNAGDGPDANEGIIIGLFVAAIVAAILISIALQVLTQKWNNRVTLLMMVAAVVTIPLSDFIASIIGERNWHLVLFPVGEAFFSALSGYWLVRARTGVGQHTTEL